ncbi:hypothetical protein PSPO01_08954 [Paraphaeosphaeria sporulosa]
MCPRWYTAPFRLRNGWTLRDWTNAPSTSQSFVLLPWSAVLQLRRPPALGSKLGSVPCHGYSKDFGELCGLYGSTSARVVLLDKCLQSDRLRIEWAHLQDDG